RGKHAKHHRVQALRSEHFSTGVFESTGALNRLIRRQVANDAGDRCNKGIGIYAGVDEKAAAKQWTLFKRMVDRDGWLRNDMHVVDIGYDANDSLKFRRSIAAVFQNRIGPEHVAIDRVLIGKHALSKRVADDGRIFFALNVEIVEIPARHDGDAQRGKKSGRDHSILCTRVLLTS